MTGHKDREKENFTAMNHILIAHESRMVNDSLRNALDKWSDVCVAGCAATEEELNFLLPHANVALIGTELGQTNIFTLLRDIRLTHPHIKIIVVGVQNDPQIILRYIEAGASGYVLADESLDEMVEKVQATAEGRALVSPTIAALMMERAAYLAHHSTTNIFPALKQEKVNELTSREREVLELIGEGFTNRAIADELVIECGTVKNHVHNILKKLESSNRQEAVALYQATQQTQNAMAYN
jgi:DNA-binding NarL/FixJ family response regulator